MPSVAKSKPVLTVASARVIAWHDHFLRVVVREGRKRLSGGGVRWVLPGGKIGRRQTFGEVIREEMLEELGLEPASDLHPVTVLHMVNRETWYSARKWRKLGYGLPGKIPGNTRILLANPVAHVYATRVDTLPPEIHAGRQLRVIDLRDDGVLDMVKPSHATVLAHWRDSILADLAMPREIHWQESGLPG